MGNRCNRRADCPDRSDERNCQIISIDETYFPEYPPLNPEGSISLRLDANIDAILDVAEVFEDVFQLLVKICHKVQTLQVAGTFRVQFELRLTWFDPRMEFYNLKELTDMNTLSIEDQFLIWVPILVMANTEKKDQTLNDESTFFTVAREGDFVRSTPDFVDNIYKFK